MNLRKINVRRFHLLSESSGGFEKRVNKRNFSSNPYPLPPSLSIRDFYELHPSTGGCLSRPGTFIGHIFIRSKKKKVIHRPRQRII